MNGAYPFLTVTEDLFLDIVQSQLNEESQGKILRYRKNEIAEIYFIYGCKTEAEEINNGFKDHYSICELELIDMLHAYYSLKVYIS